MKDNQELNIILSKLNKAKPKQIKDDFAKALYLLCTHAIYDEQANTLIEKYDLKYRSGT